MLACYAAKQSKEFGCSFGCCPVGGELHDTDLAWGISGRHASFYT